MSDVVNKDDYTKKPVKVAGIAADQLKSIIERVEKLAEEKAGIASDIQQIYSEAKGNGFDTKTIRKIISIRKKDRAELSEEEYLEELYRRALGMDPKLNTEEEETLDPTGTEE